MSASRKGRSSRVTTISPLALGSGARLSDMFPLPWFLAVFFKLISLVFKHWYVSGTILLYLLVDPLFATAFLLLIPLCFLGYMWYYNRHHDLQAIVRASLRLALTKVKWRRACEAALLNDGPRTTQLVGSPLLPWAHNPPRIADPKGNSLEFTLNLSKIGQTVNHLEENKDYLASTLSAQRARVQRITPGIARLAIEWQKNQHVSILANPKDQINATQLPRVTLDQNVLLELDTSLLVVGHSGSGKSNLTWIILNELNDLGINYKLHVIDPKKVELAELLHSPHTLNYADNSKASDDVIESFYNKMMDSFQYMKEQTPPLRKIDLDDDNPLHILIIDELLMCKQAQKGIDTQLGEILTAGRAAGFIVIADAQLGQVDAISRLRDLFPQRICMAVNSGDLTNAVLGPRSEERGARCTEITEKGVGYIYTDFAGSFQRFKPPFISDVRTIANGGVWKPSHTQEGENVSLSQRLINQTNKHRTSYVYRLYNSSNVLLYVGKAINTEKRFKQHEDKSWWSQVDMGRTIIRKYPNESAALEAETLAIKNEHPRLNISQSEHIY